jgi:hypothetical protein
MKEISLLCIDIRPVCMIEGIGVAAQGLGEVISIVRIIINA